MAEYRNETEQLLFRLPLAGSVFKKVYYDPLKKRPSSCMIPAEDFIVDYGCSDLENSERYTHVHEKISQSGEEAANGPDFIDKVKLEKPAYEPPPTARKKKTRSPASSQRRKLITGTRSMKFIPSTIFPASWKTLTTLPIPTSSPSKNRASKVLSIYRNWKQEDDDYRVPPSSILSISSTCRDWVFMASG